MTNADTANADEAKLFAAVNDGNSELVKSLIETKGVSPNSLDEHCTSALQLAAFRGHYDVCKVLLDCGADVNGTDHPHGNSRVVRLLMDAGANIHKRTAKDRDALDMAAFTGQYRCVCSMKLYVPYERFQRFTNSETLNQSKLSVKTSHLLHTLSADPLIHPVHTFLFLSDHPELVEEKKAVLRAMEGVMESYIVGKEIDELLAVKMCILLYTVKSAITAIDEDDLANSGYILLRLSKNIFLSNQNGTLNLDSFIHSVIVKFPNTRSVILQQFMKEVYEANTPPLANAYDIICRILMGNHMVCSETFCDACGDWRVPLKLCASCRKVLFNTLSTSSLVVPQARVRQ
ncbi:Ank 2 domain containing protein [Trichuris trichiura]|uniref:Ank 2 domain containing protein n=1 Tax=Trichuris trichiura TaxID=36087 RepID=A0A077Z2Y6_TRITR|nr:Ank 2 domain containing protein [Trichuris trichiura]